MVLNSCLYLDNSGNNFLEKYFVLCKSSPTLVLFSCYCYHSSCTTFEYSGGSKLCGLTS